MAVYFGMTRNCSGLRIVALAGLAAAGLILGACEEETAPPPAATGGGTTQGPPPSTAPGSTGPLRNLSNQPKSLLGRSAQTGKIAAQEAVDRDAAAAGMAAELSGEAEGLEVGGLRWSVPIAWQRNTGAGGMRAAEFRVPHPEGGEGEATAVWFHFPGGQGGSVQDNINRWAEMVRGPGDTPGEPTVHRRQINGVWTTVVELEGTYRDGMPGQPFELRPNYVFRGAIAEGPQGLVFVRLVGPRDVMYAILRDWEGLVGSTRKAGF